MKRAILCLLLAGCTTGPYHRPAEDSESFVDSSGRGRIRAGEVDDNRGFEDYVRYFKAYPDRNVRKIDITDRVVLSFVDREGRPISLRPVRILDGDEEVYRAVTGADGRLMFPPRALGLPYHARRFTAEIDGRSAPFPRQEEAEVVLDVRVPWREEVDVDVAFCLDTTGSMGDEIDRIKRTLRDVAARLDRLSPRPRLRFGMVAYRDHGDEYVTRLTDFTRDLDEFLAVLGRVEARAGGDYEEAVSEGLSVAVNDLSWRQQEAIRVLFLIGDAPPHTDQAGGADYTRAMRRALEKGIKIATIAASGLNDKGEFIWRQLAQFTLSRFMFISYGGTTRHHVGDYRESNLDDLMLRVVTQEVESLSIPRGSQGGRARGRGRDPDDFREYRPQD